MFVSGTEGPGDRGDGETSPRFNPDLRVKESLGPQGEISSFHSKVTSITHPSTPSSPELSYSRVSMNPGPGHI